MVALSAQSPGDAIPRTILTFHGVGPISKRIDAGEHDCWLELRTLEAILDAVRGLPHVQLTFDDGNASDCEIVLPALVSRGLRATFFVCSGRLNQPYFLSGEDLQELRVSGMDIGSHGVAHVPWRELAPIQLDHELQTSRRVLETACNRRIEVAACPFGAYDHRVLGGLRRAGYRWVFTSDGGTAIESDWLQARTTITRSMQLSDVQRIIRQPRNGLYQRLIHLRGFFKRLR